MSTLQWRAAFVSCLSLSLLAGAACRSPAPCVPEPLPKSVRDFEAMKGAGDLEGIEKLMQHIRAEYSKQIRSVKAQTLLYTYDQWYYRALCEIGYVRLALCDRDGAEQHFRQFIADVDSLEVKLKAEGRPIDSVLAVFRDFRARPLLNYIDEFHGKVPSVDFDLQDMWATEKKLTLRESRGKVVAVVFRRPGDRRSQGFLQALDALVKHREKEGLAGLTVGFLSGTRTSEGGASKLQEMAADLKSLGVSLPAGFDPDSQKQSIFRGTFATVGTASFALFNREGEHAWFLQDAKDADSKVAARVIDRLLKEEAKEGTPRQE